MPSAGRGPGIQPLRGKGLHFFIQARLVSSGFIFVHDAFGDHAVDQRQGICQRGAGCAGVSRSYGCVYALNIGAHHGSLTGILDASFFSLSGAFSSLCTISQGFLHLGR